MERYVEPMLEVIRVDGRMEAAFEEMARLLHLAGERMLFREAAAAERQLRLLRLVSRFALRVFQQSRREIQPLYETLRRASFIAEGAVLALARIQRSGPEDRSPRHVLGIQTLRSQHVPGDVAIADALHRVVRFETAHPAGFKNRRNVGVPSHDYPIE